MEDDDVAIQTYRNVLQEKQFDLLIVKTIKRALSDIENFKPDLVLADIHLPDGNGIEFCHTIKTMPALSFTPRIIVTSDTDINTLKEAYQAGISDFITKPFNTMELLMRIENALRFKKLLQEYYQKSAQQTIDEMSLSLEHYVTQYLTVIKGVSKLIELKIDVKNPDLKELLTIISKATDELEETVLKFKKLTPQYTTLNISDMIKIIKLD